MLTQSKKKYSWFQSCKRHYGSFFQSPSIVHNRFTEPYIQEYAIKPLDKKRRELPDGSGSRRFFDLAIQMAKFFSFIVWLLGTLLYGLSQAFLAIGTGLIGSIEWLGIKGAALLVSPSIAKKSVSIEGGVSITIRSHNLEANKQCSEILKNSINQIQKDYSDYISSGKFIAILKKIKNAFEKSSEFTLASSGAELVAGPAESGNTRYGSPDSHILYAQYKTVFALLLQEIRAERHYYRVSPPSTLIERQLRKHFLCILLNTVAELISNSDVPQETLEDEVIEGDTEFCEGMCTIPLNIAIQCGHEGLVTALLSRVSLAQCDETSDVYAKHYHGSSKNVKSYSIALAQLADANCAAEKAVHSDEQSTRVAGQILMKSIEKDQASAKVLPKLSPSQMNFQSELTGKEEWTIDRLKAYYIFLLKDQEPMADATKQLQTFLASSFEEDMSDIMAYMTFIAAVLIRKGADLDGLVVEISETSNTGFAVLAHSLESVVLSGLSQWANSVGRSGLSKS